MYLTLFDYSESLAANVQKEVLSPTAFLYTESEFLLRTELRNPARYMSIFEAPATVATHQPRGTRDRLGEAVQSKCSRSHVADEFLRFWYRFVEPNRSSTEDAPGVVFNLP